MWLNIFEGIAIPFIGTALGSACVFFMKRELNRKIQRALTGFAGGVMVAASLSVIYSIVLFQRCKDSNLQAWGRRS